MAASELDLILRSGEDKVGLTSYERKNIAKYADLGWNLTEGIHMSSPDIYRNTPFAINAAEKVELYKYGNVFLHQKQPKVPDVCFLDSISDNLQSFPLLRVDSFTTNDQK